MLLNYSTRVMISSLLVQSVLVIYLVLRSRLRAHASTRIDPVLLRLNRKDCPICKSSRAFRYVGLTPNSIFSIVEVLYIKIKLVNFIGQR